MTVREIPHHSCTLSDFTVKSLQRIICACIPPVIKGEFIELERLLCDCLNDVDCLAQPKRFEFGSDLLRFLPCRFLIFLSMDCLQHGGNDFRLTGRNCIQDISIEMHHYTALPATFWKEITNTKNS